MNAVIVELRKKQAAALDESGRIVRIHNADYEIGQKIELHEVRPVRSAPVLKRLSTGVAAAVLVAVIGTGTAYAVPYGTVTLDGNSSVEYTINCFDYVLDVKGTNEEGEALLSEIDKSQLRHHRIDAAVVTTVEHMEQHAPTEQVETELHISADTSSDRHSERLRLELEPLVEHTGEPVMPKGALTSDIISPFRAESQPQPTQKQFPESGQAPQQVMHPEDDGGQTEMLNPVFEQPMKKQERSESPTDAALTYQTANHPPQLP